MSISYLIQFSLVWYIVESVTIFLINILVLIYYYSIFIKQINSSTFPYKIIKITILYHGENKPKKTGLNLKSSNWSGPCSYELSYRNPWLRHPNLYIYIKLIRFPLSSVHTNSTLIPTLSILYKATLVTSCRRMTI